MFRCTCKPGQPTAPATLGGADALCTSIARPQSVVTPQQGRFGGLCGIGRFLRDTKKLRPVPKWPTGVPSGVPDSLLDVPEQRSGRAIRRQQEILPIDPSREPFV